jgi:hypothetical protein
MLHNSDTIRTAILETIVRFDIFEYPLTAFEIWQYLPIKVSYAEVLSALEQNTVLEKENGFYFLAGRKHIIVTRHTRYRDSDAKIKIARRLISLISWLPWIRLIALANVIGAHNLKKSSDLDLFIITKKNRLWLTKFTATIIVALLGLRPTAKHSKNRLCLSFLVDESGLDLKSCRYNDKDWYFSYWLAGLRPLYGSPEAYTALYSANSWLKSELPNWQISSPQPHKYFSLKNRSPKVFNACNGLERISKYLHHLIMSGNLREKQNRDTAVMINDHILKLHTLDRRPDFFQRAEQKLAQINL